MKKACLVVSSPYQRNEIFNPNSRLNRDNCLSFYRDLKAELERAGLSLDTQDITPELQADCVIYNELPQSPCPNKQALSVAFLFESELIRPQDWVRAHHSRVNFNFTWNDELVDNKKYFKFNFTHAGQVPFKKFSEKKKICTLIAGNKIVTHPLELYSERVAAIDWFTAHAPQDFDFYGMGWDRYTFTFPLIGRGLNRLNFLRKSLAKKYPLYRGPVADKLTTLSDYRFSICYENAHSIPGYITEKIFDSLAAGCVPVYWGAPNIKDSVPESCFIDRTRFKSYEELYHFLKSMSEQQYNRYLENIEEYLKSEKHQLFEPLYNAREVAKVIASEITKKN